LRRAVLGLGLLAVLAAIIPAAIDALISISTASAIAERVEDAAPKPVALLLGTASKTAAGRPNQFYQARIRSAAELFHGGKVQGILVSGDNATRWYNEPITMQKDLIAARWSRLMSAARATASARTISNPTCAGATRIVW
jgi:SanA protein